MIGSLRILRTAVRWTRYFRFLGRLGVPQPWSRSAVVSMISSLMSALIGRSKTPSRPCKVEIIPPRTTDTGASGGSGSDVETDLPAARDFFLGERFMT